VEHEPIAGDPRFFRRTGPHSLAAVADAAQGEAPPRRLLLAGVAPLQAAGPDHVSFVDNKKYLAALEQTQAGAVIVRADLAERVPKHSVPIVMDQPYEGWARVAALFHPLPPLRPGIHPTAVVGEEASIDPTAQIGPLAVIGARARIGRRCLIGPHAIIGEGVEIDQDCRIGAHVTLSHALLGCRVVIYPGARIGQDGFGFAMSEKGFLSVPQLGRVILEDDVEVGANTAIDRGSAQDTVIGAGSRLDNMIQIGHNVRLGRCCVVVAQAGISGSSELGDFVVVAAQAGLTGHLKIGQRARIGAQAGVMADVPPGLDVVGSPAQPARAFFRQVAILRKLARGKTASRTDGQAASSAEAAKTD
jgi:UDP-3-O-[3-hydroxymyristoyl] glucosamine N-acyltransferase